MKTRSFIALASFAGLAHADTAINAHNHDSEHLGQALVLDVSGYQFWDEQGSVNNETLEILIGFGCTITSVSWDINLTTFTSPDANFPSWAQEATMTLGGVEQIVFAPGMNTGVVNQNFAGHTDFLTPLHLDHDGILSIEFWESFDDAPGFADAVFEPGSTITLYIPWICIPSPSISASFLFTGLIASRRKRKSHSSTQSYR